MKYTYLILMWAMMHCMNIKAQNGPLFGSGKVVNRSYDFKNFEKLNIKDFDGLINVNIGSTWSINISIDDNLLDRLALENDIKNQTLNLYLKGNENGKLYLENTHIKINITMPKSSYIYHSGNSVLIIKGLEGRSFTFEGKGNGKTSLLGSVDQLNITHSGNGDVDAKNCPSLTADVKKYGNGNIVVNSQLSLTAIGNGNGNVAQVGHGDIKPLSGIVGNGRVYKK